MSKKKTVKNKTPQKVSAKNINIKALVFAATAAVLVVSIVVAGFGIRNYRLKESVEYAFVGTLENKSVRAIEISEEEQLERVKEMKRKGQKSKFDFFCNTGIEFEYATAYGSLVLANVATNDSVFVVSILDEDGNLIYRSGGIEPGKYLSQIRLFAPPENGKHDCRLYVSAYDPNTNELIGVQYTNLTIWIGVSAGEE